MKKRVIVLGNLPLATKVLKLLRSRDDVDIIGVICPGVDVAYPASDTEVCANAYCRVHGIPRLGLDDVVGLDKLDLAISARNNTILRTWFLDRFRLGVVNCHGGYLPDYKGVGGHIFPIMNDEDHTGGTVHWMNERIDDGELIDRRKVVIEPCDTGASLFTKINDEIFTMVQRNLGAILAGTAPRINQSELRPETRSGQSYFYRQKDIRMLIEQLHEPAPSIKVERALYWPGKQTPRPKLFHGLRIHRQLRTPRENEAH